MAQFTSYVRANTAGPGACMLGGTFGNSSLGAFGESAPGNGLLVYATNDVVLDVYEGKRISYVYQGDKQLSAAG